MLKIIGLLSITGLLLALSAVPAKATCMPVNNLTIPQTGLTLNSGEFCYSKTYDFASFTGIGTYNGQSVNVVAVANVTQGSKQVTVSGSISVTGAGINKSVTFSKTVPIQLSSAALTGLIAWGEKLVEQLKP